MASDSGAPSSGTERFTQPTRRSFVAGGLASAGLTGFAAPGRPTGATGGAHGGRDPWENRGLYFGGPVSHEAIGIMLHWLRRWPGTSVYARVSFLSTGGRANALPAEATAFVHRGNEWYMIWYLKWGEKDSRARVAENLRWLSDFYDAMAPHALPEAYQNFTDPSLKDYLHQYYGRNVPRLRRIKSAVDPTRVFNFPQAIPPGRGHG